MLHKHFQRAAKFKQDDLLDTVTITPKKTIVMVTDTRLGKYTYCPLTHKATHVTCTFTKTKYKCSNIEHSTCELDNIIDFITCKFLQHEIYGRNRQTIHKTNVGTYSLYEKEFQDHTCLQTLFNGTHSHTQMRFSVLEWCSTGTENPNTARRRQTELGWILGCTLYTYLASTSLCKVTLICSHHTLND